MSLIIPTNSDTESFAQVTSLDGQTFEFRFSWLERADAWSFDLLTEDGEVLARGIRIVVNWPLLRRLIHPRRPLGEILALASGGVGAPKRNDLGTRVVLHYASPQDMARYLASS